MVGICRPGVVIDQAWGTLVGVVGFVVGTGMLERAEGILNLEPREATVVLSEDTSPTKVET